LSHALFVRGRISRLSEFSEVRTGVISASLKFRLQRMHLGRFRLFDGPGPGLVEDYYTEINTRKPSPLAVSTVQASTERMATAPRVVQS